MEEDLLSENKHTLKNCFSYRHLGIGLSFLLAVILVLTLIPIFSLSRYAWPAFDDFSYGLHTHRALERGTSLAGAIWYTVKSLYLNWQGSVAAMALMSVSPTIFSEQLYWITTVVMLVSLIGGTLKLSHTLVCRGLKGEWWKSLLVALPILILSIQFVPSPREAFYWWNGAIYYTFTYGIALLYVERAAALFLAPEGHFPWGAVLPGALCGLFVGGSNYVSALFCAMLSGCLLLYGLYRKKCRTGMLVLFLAEAIPFIVSMLAPGNQHRQGYVTPMSPISAIFSAIQQAWADLLKWPDWLTLTLCLAWIPLLAGLARKSGLKFRLPLVFVVFTFLFFAAQNTPHFYAASYVGPGRLRNIVFYSHFWLILLNEWYLLGWFQRCVLPRLSGWERLKKPVLAGWTCAVLLLLVKWGSFYMPQMLFSRCSAAVSDGSAAAYVAEQNERLAELKNPDVKDVVFEPLEVVPPLLLGEDLTADSQHWANKALANYYRKQSVTVGPRLDQSQGP